MINETSIEFFNEKLTFDYTNIKNLTQGQKDRVRNYGSQAENLLKNRDFALFVHQFKFEITDQIANIRGHSQDDNTQRIALANELSGIDNFVSTLKRAVYYKNKLGNAEIAPE